MSIGTAVTDADVLIMALVPHLGNPAMKKIRIGPEGSIFVNKLSALKELS